MTQSAISLSWCILFFFLAQSMRMERLKQNSRIFEKHWLRFQRFQRLPNVILFDNSEHLKNFQACRHSLLETQNFSLKLPLLYSLICCQYHNIFYFSRIFIRTSAIARYKCEFQTKNGYASSVNLAALVN